MSKGLDQNLFFCAFALRAGLISESIAMDAIVKWGSQPELSLGEILVKSKDLSEENRALIDSLVKARLESQTQGLPEDETPVENLGEILTKIGMDSDSSHQSGLDVLTVVSGLSDRRDEPPELTGDSKQSSQTRFTVLRPLAEGGLGKVSVAFDNDLKRLVAFKQIQKKLSGNRELRNRFTVEAEITGNLEHPGIVPIYALGDHHDGTPFYAMKYIRGESFEEEIRRYHSKNETSPQQPKQEVTLQRLLSRFIDVCHAMAFAHDRGVLHRDLKPANIMVGGYGETLVVDWGLAKALGKVVGQGGDTGSKTGPGESASNMTGNKFAGIEPIDPNQLSGDSHTRAGSFMGTPGFASPEQAEGLIDSLDGRSDIYSLGAILYYVLTGQKPFYLGQDKVAVADVLRRQKSGELIAPRVVNSSIHKHIEAICLKAMALKPANRYQTVSELRNDIEHFLADETVSVVKDTVIDRCRRWSRKHPGVVSTGAVVVVAGMILMGSGLYIVNAEREIAEQARLGEHLQKVEAVRLQKGAEIARAQEAEQRKQAEIHLSFAKKGVEILGSVFRGIDPGVVADSGRPLQLSLQDNLKKANSALDAAVIHDPIELARLKSILGESLFALGDAENAILALTHTVEGWEKTIGENDPRTIRALMLLASSHRYQGHADVALPMNKRALALAQKYLKSYDPLINECFTSLILTSHVAGFSDEVLPLAEKVVASNKEAFGLLNRQTLSSMSDLAACYDATGRLEEALRTRKEVLDRRTELLGEFHPTTLGSMNDYGYALNALKRHNEAIDVLGKTVRYMTKQVGKSHPMTCNAMLNLSRAYQKAGQIDMSNDVLEQRVYALREQLGTDRLEVAAALTELAANYRAAGQHDKSLRSYEESLVIRRKLQGVSHPETIVNLIDVGWEYHGTGNPAMAQAIFAEVLPVCEMQYGREDHKTLTCKIGLGEAYCKLKNFERAEQPLRECLEVREKVQPLHWRALKTRLLLAEALDGQGRYSEAEPLLLKNYGLLVENMIEGVPSHSVMRLEFIDRLIRHYEVRGQADEVQKWKQMREEQSR